MQHQKLWSLCSLLLTVTQHDLPPVLLCICLQLGGWRKVRCLCLLQTHDDSNLVDSASSHTLVSKIKPCMSKYKSLTLKLRTAHYISYSLFDSPLLLG